MVSEGANEAKALELQLDRNLSIALVKIVFQELLNKNQFRLGAEYRRLAVWSVGFP